MQDKHSKYYKVPDGQIAYFDVDQTLVLWERDINHVLEGTEGSIDIEFRGKTVHLRPIICHVNQIIQQKLKGLNVVVWSAGGADWAETVVKALELEDYVDVILTKPNFLYDDAKPEKFMKNLYYFADKEIEDKQGDEQEKPPRNLIEKMR